MEKTGKKFESVAQGLIRGLQVLHFETNSKDDLYTLVVGWSAEDAKGTERLEKNPKDSGAAQPKGKKVDDRKVTSKDAKKFLP